MRRGQTTGTGSNELSLVSVAIDGEVVDANSYSHSSEHLKLYATPPSFELTTRVTIDPANNTSLEGLYKADGAYCTQCEAEGFRRITYFLDRPDVLSKYRTKIIANKASHPYLMSNGNKIDSSELDGGKHWVLWEDPFDKPSYLFCACSR